MDTESGLGPAAAHDGGGALEWVHNDNLDLAYREVLTALLMDGLPVGGVSDASVGGGQQTLERRNYSFELSDPRDRVLALQSHRLKATLAVGRFIWMMAGNDRLDDVRFYQTDGLTGDRTKGVGQFSDDGLTIPGSNYGQRLFRPRPGVDQVASCIKLIRDDPNTRRAAMTVYQPEDAGRESGDIPCTFGVLLGPRDEKLHQTVVMRSNNAWDLLPYNIFEFSLLGEVIASECDLDVGSYHHFAISMHLYDRNVDAATKAVSEPSTVLTPFEPMPSGSLGIVRQLCAWESWIRYASAGFKKSDIKKELRRLDPFRPYWSDFGRVVLAKAFSNRGLKDEALEIAAGTPGPLGELVRLEMLPPDSSSEQLSLDLRPSPIPDFSQEVLDELRLESMARAEQERTNTRFHIIAAAEHAERMRSSPKYTAR